MPAPAGEAGAVPASDFPDSSRNPISLVFASRFLLATAVLTLLLSWVNTNGENLLFRVVQEFLKAQAVTAGITDPRTLLAFTRDGISDFYGDFFFWVNVAALILQAIAASRWW